jgi:hypothetical protein
LVRPIHLPPKTHAGIRWLAANGAVSAVAAANHDQP